jgi:hypothetical protein
VVALILIYGQLLTKNQILIFFLIPVLTAFFHIYYFLIFKKKYFLFFMIFLTFFSIAKYHYRYNEKKYFMDFRKFEIEKSSKAEQIDKMFGGLNWITPFDYYERSKQEVVLLNEIKNFILLNKQKDRPILITDYLFFSAISNLEIPSPIKWYDDVIIPEKNNKYYNYYKIFFVKKMLNNNVKNIYLIGNMSSHIFLDLIENKKCVIFTKINDLMSVYNIDQCKFIL